MNEEILMHHGIKGQKWGVRRFQNADGSLTVVGRKRYNTSYVPESRRDTKIPSGVISEDWGKRDSRIPSGAKSLVSKATKSITDDKKDTLAKIGKAALVAGAVVATGIAVSKNKDACAEVLKHIGNKAISSTTNASAIGKKYVTDLAKQAYQGAKDGIKQAPQKIGEGIREGMSEAPKKVAKAAVEGATIIATKKLLEATIGKEQMDSYTKAYNAYNKKNKIGQVNTSSKKKDEDEDDD